MFDWREGFDWSVIPKTDFYSQPVQADEANRDYYPFNWREGIDWSLIPNAWA